MILQCRNLNMINQIHRHKRRLIPTIKVPPIEDEGMLKAVKADDASIQNSIWDLKTLTIRKEIVYNADVASTKFY